MQGSKIKEAEHALDVFADDRKLAVNIQRMEKIRRRFEFIFFDAVIGDSFQAQAGHDGGGIRLVELALFEKPLFGRTPVFGISATAVLDLGVQVDQEAFDAHRDRRWRIAFFAGRRQVVRIMKIELFDWRKTTCPIGAEHQVEGLANRAFPGVILAHQERMAVEV